MSSLVQWNLNQNITTFIHGNDFENTVSEVMITQFGLHELTVSTEAYGLTARFVGPTWGPSRADRTQVGPMLAPWTLLSGCSCSTFLSHLPCQLQFYHLNYFPNKYQFNPDHKLLHHKVRLPALYYAFDLYYWVQFYFCLIRRDYFAYYSGILVW